VTARPGWSCVRCSEEWRLEISLAKVPTPEPAEDEIVVRVEGAPLNPSDLGLLIGPAICQPPRFRAPRSSRRYAKVPEAALKAMAGRLDESMPVAMKAPAW